MFRLPTGVVLTLALSGCQPAPPRSSEAVPPFREEPFGAGLDRSSGGRRVDLVDDGGRLVARWRISASAARVYASDATQIGRIVPASSGWSVERVDGTRACTLLVEADAASLECESGLVALVRDEGGWAIHLDERPFARVQRSGSAEWALSYEGGGAPVVRFEEGRLSEQTHADARVWMRSEPASWSPVVLVASRVALPGLEPRELELQRGAIAFALARLTDARVEVVPPRSGSR